MTIARARIIKAAEIRAANGTPPGAGVESAVPALTRAETPDARRDPSAPSNAANATHSVPSSALQSDATLAMRVDGVITQLIGSNQSSAHGEADPYDADSATRIGQAPQPADDGTDTLTRIAQAPSPAARGGSAGVHGAGARSAVAGVAPTMESAHDVVAQAATEDARVRPLAVLNRADAFARRIPRVVVDAKTEAARIVADAKARASAVAEEAARVAREAEVAKHAAQVLALREADERRAERDLERTIAIATLLAERLVGEALAVNPARVTELAAAALEQTRGATSIRIDAHPADVETLTAALRDFVQITRIEPDLALRRGSLVVHTNLGKVDARLEPQLARLATALREGTLA